MKSFLAVVLGVLISGLLLSSGVYAEDACPDPWVKLQGTYKCEGPCNYSATVCNLPEYATGYKRWRFTNGRGGTGTISFATAVSGWTFTAANTSDCGATIQFDGEPKGVTWRRVDESARACGSRSRAAAR
jgi:hypothetical protein